MDCIDDETFCNVMSDMDCIDDETFCNVISLWIVLIMFSMECIDDVA